MRAGEDIRTTRAGQTCRAWGVFGLGALEAFCVMAIFVILGFGWVTLLEAAPTEPPRYAGDPVPTSPDQPRHWMIDGFNVVQHGLLGGRDRECWWTASRRAELIERSAAFDDPDAEIWLVFDGPRPLEGDGAPQGPHLVFAPSADAWLLARVRDADDPTQIAIVTADRRLAARARHHGARVVAPIEFLRRCPG